MANANGTPYPGTNLTIGDVARAAVSGNLKDIEGKIPGTAYEDVRDVGCSYLAIVARLLGGRWEAAAVELETAARRIRQRHVF